VKVKIHPDYTALDGFIRSIPSGGYDVEKTFRNHRNTVEKVNANGHCLVIKRYKVPTWANQVIYTFFRKNKALRAYQNALRLLSMGIDTARPVAYIVKRRWGLYHKGWFVCEYLPYETLFEAASRLKGSEAGEQLTHDFLDFMVLLHEKAVVLKDSNPSNVLVHREGEHWEFALVDINRMEFGKSPGLAKSMHSFDELGIDVEQMALYLPQYCEARGFELEKSVFFVLLSRGWRRLRHHVKACVKKVFVRSS